TFSLTRCQSPRASETSIWAGKGRRRLVASVLPVVLCLLVSVPCLTGQASPARSVPQSDSTALSLAAQSMAALTRGSPLSDVTLTAQASRFAGSDNETGVATLAAKGTGNSRVDLVLSGGRRTEIRTVTAGFPTGTWSGIDGASHECPAHNCWTDAVWFFPALLSFSTAGSDPNLVLSYVGGETRAGVQVQHIRSRYRSDLGLFQRLSRVDIYVDQTSHLPVAITFNTHADNDANLNIPVEIQFSDYREVNGVKVPFQINKLLSGTLVLQLSVSNATINTGLPDSYFKL
nr:hypothetical protein [Acidobacteriota bacterium]